MYEAVETFTSLESGRRYLQGEEVSDSERDRMPLQDRIKFRRKESSNGGSTIPDYNSDPAPNGYPPLGIFGPQADDSPGDAHTGRSDVQFGGFEGGSGGGGGADSSWDSGSSDSGSSDSGSSDSGGGDSGGGGD